MSTFVWFIIGHLIGDWLLQNHWMAVGKKEGLVTLAGLVHFTIYTITIVSLFLVAGSGVLSLFELGVLAVFIFVTHWLIDATPIVEWWSKAFHQSDLVMVRVMVDQVLHILVLALISLVIGSG